jgi:hypothetical protein
MIYDETIAYALMHPEGVRYDSSPTTVDRDREGLHKAALKMTPKPITIFTRTQDTYPYVYLLVKQFDPTGMETVDGKGILRGPTTKR